MIIFSLLCVLFVYGMEEVRSGSFSCFIVVVLSLGIVVFFYDYIGYVSFDNVVFVIKVEYGYGVEFGGDVVGVYCVGI